ncbi:MAG: hypothetical protein MZV63_27515 [Marinilabiliales bacterium]|nr:hypothetical protein [Marinilabiliales bacterium]
MITRNQAKMILSLQKRKVREENSLFVIEGDKLVREYIMAGNRVSLLAGKPEWIDGEPEAVIAGADEIVTVSYEELRRISSLKTPHNVLAVAPMAKADYSDQLLTGRAHSWCLSMFRTPAILEQSYALPPGSECQTLSVRLTVSTFTIRK